MKKKAVTKSARRKAQVVTEPRVHFRAYDLISRAVEEGVAYGWRRAHKHVEKPEEHKLKEEIESAIMASLCEIMDFES